MAIGKTIKKTLPYELYDVAGLEDWFAQMAAEGLHLISCSGDRAAFTPGEPKAGVRFRLEAQGTYEIDQNKNDEYAQSGWEHVTTIRGFFYVFRCDEPEIAELHTDPTIQSWTMKKLIRRQWLWFLYWPLYWLFMLRDHLKLLFTGPSMLAMEFVLKDGMLIGYGVMIFGAAYLTLCQMMQFNALRALKKRLASGLPMDREKRYPRSFWRHGFLWVLVGLLIAMIPLAILLENRQTRDVSPENYPHVTLEELIPGQYVYPDEGLGFWKGAELDASLFVPVQFEYGDAAVLDGEWTRVRTYLRYYETVSPTAAEVILKGSIQALRRDLEEDRDRHETYPELFNRLVLDTGPISAQHDELDALYHYDYQFRNSEYHRVYFGRVGSKAFVLYTMLPEPEAALELMIAKIEQQ